jgi:hexosaminidase
MTEKILLLPMPRRLTPQSGQLELPVDSLILLDGPAPAKMLLAAQQLQQTLTDHADRRWRIVAGRIDSAAKIGLTLSLTPDAVFQPQGYRLNIAPTGIFMAAADPAGLFYAAQTLTQLIQQYHANLPWLTIIDWPDFVHRGVMLDISRNKVPTMATLYSLIDRLAGWKINQLQLYTEHTFAYQNHPDVWANASPLTGEEILALDVYCRERFIELIPNQNTFGHMRRWLIHDRYRPLAECPHGCDTGDPEWGYFTEPFTLCPGDPGSLKLVHSLLDELLPHFSSRQFNAGCDETVDLGRGRSLEVVTERGKGRVYLDFLLEIYRAVKARGRTMQFWADVIINYPELVGELPRDAIAMEWGYEADHPFDDHAARLAETGIPFYVCAGTSSWNSLAGRTDNALANLAEAARSGLTHGAHGYLITDWGDTGHWQPLPVSYLGFAVGAALGWGYEANHLQDAAQLTSLFAFDDPSGAAGQLAYDLGNAYLQPGVEIHNGSALFWILQKEPEEIRAMTGLNADALQRTLTWLDQLPAVETIPFGHNADLLWAEFGWVVDALRHACRRGLWGLGQVDLRPILAADADRLLTVYRQNWLARNRPGGLPDSMALLEKMRRVYDSESTRS